MLLQALQSHWMAKQKCEVWSLGNPTAAAELAKTLGMKHTAGLVMGQGCAKSLYGISYKVYIFIYNLYVKI
jgi:3-oxoacyl-[acyl-carrier-protein] synthase III